MSTRRFHCSGGLASVFVGKEASVRGILQSIGARMVTESTCRRKVPGGTGASDRGATGPCPEGGFSIQNNQHIIAAERGGDR